LAPFLAADAEQVLELAARVPTDRRRSIDSAALRAIARTDPLAAIRHIERQPAGNGRDSLFADVAGQYAKLDPEAAIRWARSLEPASRSVAAAVAETIAETDLERAIELELDPEWSGGAAVDVRTATRVAADSDRARRLADVLAARSDADARAFLDTLVRSWSSADTEAAFAWLKAHAEIADGYNLSFVARNIGSGDPDAAARRIDELPPAMREEWAVQVAMLYAERDLPRAAEWLERFRGEPAYDAALGPIIARRAGADPRLAARLLPSASRAMRYVASEQLARTWVLIEPTAAAEWAESILEPELRAAAVAAVAAEWAKRDAAAAQDWLARLPAATRDRVISRPL
jgi:hypothetical protein